MLAALPHPTLLRHRLHVAPATRAGYGTLASMPLTDAFTVDVIVALTTVSDLAPSGGSVTMTTFVFAPSTYLPIAIGFFGLGTGYFIWGGQALFGIPDPKMSPGLDKTMGMWGFWMPGFMQFITGSSPDADGWMAIAFLILSILGVYVFIAANDIPVAIVFIGLCLIYLTEIPARFVKSAAAARTVGLFQFLTGIWLMYMTIATVINFSLGGKLWL
jgi:hypothetical protein